MIKSPEEFIKLRNSHLRNEYLRAAHESAPIEVPITDAGVQKVQSCEAYRLWTRCSDQLVRVHRTSTELHQVRALVGRRG